MFNSVKELKAFITWAKNNHLKRVKVGEIELEISDLAFIPEYNPPKVSNKRPKNPETDKITHTEAPPAAEIAEDDPDLYYSVTN